jgi:hypothetical protein
MIQGNQTQPIFIHTIEFAPLFLILSDTYSKFNQQLSIWQSIYTVLAGQLERAFIETTFLLSMRI